MVSTRNSDAAGLSLPARGTRRTPAQKSEGHIDHGSRTVPKQACPLRPGRAADSLPTPQLPLNLRNVRINSQIGCSRQKLCYLQTSTRHSSRLAGLPTSKVRFRLRHS